MPPWVERMQSHGDATSSTQPGYQNKVTHAKAENRSVLAIIAPAGFGKTVQALHWVRAALRDSSGSTARLAEVFWLVDVLPDHDPQQRLNAILGRPCPYGIDTAHNYLRSLMADYPDRLRVSPLPLDPSLRTPKPKIKIDPTRLTVVDDCYYADIESVDGPGDVVILTCSDVGDVQDHVRGSPGYVRPGAFQCGESLVRQARGAS